MLARMRSFFILFGAQLSWEGLIGNSFCQQDLVAGGQKSGKASRIEELNEVVDCVRDANESVMILKSDSLDSLQIFVRTREQNLVFHAFNVQLQEIDLGTYRFQPPCQGPSFDF